MIKSEFDAWGSKFGRQNDKHKRKRSDNCKIIKIYFNLITCNVTNKFEMLNVIDLNYCTDTIWEFIFMIVLRTALLEIIIFFSIFLAISK